MTSAPRVERVDDLVVDSQGLDPPTDKWLQAAREAADTDGIRENAYAERLQMCISCCTLMCMFPMVNSFLKRRHEPLGAAGAPTLPVRETSTLSVCSARLTG